MRGVGLDEVRRHYGEDVALAMEPIRAHPRGRATGRFMPTWPEYTLLRANRGAASGGTRRGKSGPMSDDGYERRHRCARKFHVIVVDPKDLKG
jgi:hypothetical protein